MFNFELDRNAEQSLYRQIYEKIKEEILENRFTPDTKMPSIRKLASELEVNPETVVKAYNILEAENYIYKKEGSGSFISPASSEIKENKDIDRRLRVLSSKEDGEKSLINFSGIFSNEEIIKSYDINTIFEEVWFLKSGGIFSALNSEENELQKLIEQFPVKTGCQKNQYSGTDQLDLIFFDLFSESDFILVEEPGEIDLIKRLSKQNKSPSIEGIEDINFDKLMSYLENNKIDYLFLNSDPSFENVCSWSADKKKSLLDLAHMLKFKIIVVDSYYFWDEDKPKDESFYKIDKKNTVIQIVRMTRTLFPGLDIGLIVFPDGQTQIENKEFNLNSAGDHLISHLLSYYISTSYLQKRIKILKHTLKNRSIISKNELLAHMPEEIKLETSDSGFYIKIILPKKINIENFLKRAKRNDILLADQNNFYYNRKENNNIIFSYAAVDEFTIRQGIIRFAEIYRKFIKENSI
ncbi:GntR family transcriptional regulator [Halanaerobium sp. MA284_MarDTE_T2]|uniref:GntR family transcriptional regulator n=1 Tax=Halanaerobium sp. MA284_MarDTE_T2 TaxID=2183913 RepID=UPI000E152CFD|nr:PLP-dependent aminotransferase family protein [Halanaerobium sp. MA284_MarDTE_T2]RCW43770.1 GntR family transcriptional regulator [Halanaerobium sp. MA284_MarDTE_T2]